MNTLTAALAIVRVQQRVGHLSFMLAPYWEHPVAGELQALCPGLYTLEQTRQDDFSPEQAHYFHLWLGSHASWEACNTG